MSVLVVGSVALDSVETPAGRVQDALGGSATFFSAAASLFGPVQLVGVIGSDYPGAKLDFLAQRGVDMAGLERAEGESFRWAGVYSSDFSSRETLETRLGVFAEFRPKIPAEFREAEWVFLGNIDPLLQAEVLDQIPHPRLVACDTMNFWISTRRDELLELLKRVDLLFLNDEEVRQLSGEPLVVRAAQWVQRRGPRHVIVKKGEHGAMLFSDGETFFLPGFPLDEVTDPTGAGDAFAGGVMGHLAQTGRADAAALRRAIAYGSALGSYAVESFGPDRLRELGMDEIEARVRRLQEMTSFELHAGAALV